MRLRQSFTHSRFETLKWTHKLLQITIEKLDFCHLSNQIILKIMYYHKHSLDKPKWERELRSRFWILLVRVKKDSSISVIKVGITFFDTFLIQWCQYKILDNLDKQYNTWWNAWSTYIFLWKIPKLPTLQLQECRLDL